MLSIPCPSCGHSNGFDQDSAYHAGFANQGFLYNEAGNMTFVWSSFDPAYEAIAGHQHPWALTEEYRARVEAALRLAPSGGRWLFKNSARCRACTGPVSEPITKTIYYLVYPGSIIADMGPPTRNMKDFLLSGS